MKETIHPGRIFVSKLFLPRGTLGIMLVFGMLILTVLTIFPYSVSAFSITDQSAIRLTDDTFLFSITYRLSFLNRDLLVPIFPTYASNEEVDSVSPFVQYSFLNTVDEQVRPSQVSAFIGSKENIESQQYTLQRGSAGFFTLYAIARFEADVLRSESGLRMQINQLPFTLLDEGVLSSAQIPAENLVEFHTSLAW